MNKKGFTLIEIIICISLLAVVGIGSFLGIKYVDNKIRIDKLSQITDKAIEAAQIYIETDKEASNALYSNSNGVSVPLQFLVNKGLLNIDNTDLTLDDLKDEYVVTFLGGSGGNENCEQITSSASWANDKPLYLCMNSNGDSNLATIDPNKYGNLTTITNEPYYFKGPNPDNYVLVGQDSNGDDEYARIYKVERDDSLVLFHRYYHHSTASKRRNLEVFLSLNENNTKVIDVEKKLLYSRVSYNALCYSINGCIGTHYYNYENTLYFNLQGTNEPLSFKKYDYSDISDYSYLEYDPDNNYTRLYYLKPCFKIKSGTGSYASPFILDSSACS